MGGGVSKSRAGAMRAARWRDAFLKEASLERDLAVRTRAAYGRDLDLLLRFLERREVTLEKVATGDLIAFLASRRRSGDQRATRARRAAAMRSFFGWLRESGRIDLNPALLRVMGKGRKERKVPLGNPGIEGLRQWIKRGRPRIETPESGDRVFITARGKPLSRDGVYRAVKRRVRLAGLDTHVSPHTLRHTFATHLVQNGADLRAVQEMLGHASINTTQVYTTLADEHLREAHRKHHPRG